LFAAELALVVLVVVEFGVVSFYAVEEQVTSLLKERIDREI
jgi:hypothetical protein